MASTNLEDSVSQNSRTASQVIKVCPKRFSAERQSSLLLISLYQEFKKMVCKYDESVVKTLTPLMVSVLESINRAYQINQEYEFTLQLLEEDNKQLEKQYEEEKKTKYNMEQEFTSYKEFNEGKHKELLDRVNVLKSKIHLLEIRHQNLLEYARILEERERDLHREYDLLHGKYIELFRAYIIYSERTELSEILRNDLNTIREHFAKLTQEKTETSKTKLNQIISSIISLDGDDTKTFVKRDVKQEISLSKDNCGESSENNKEFKEVWFNLQGKSSTMLTKESSTLLIPKLKKRISDLQQELRTFKKGIKNHKSEGDDCPKTLSPSNSRGIYTKADMARYLLIKNHFYMGLQESVQWAQLLNTPFWALYNVSPLIKCHKRQ